MKRAGNRGNGRLRVPGGGSCFRATKVKALSLSLSLAPSLLHLLFCPFNGSCRDRGGDMHFEEGRRKPRDPSRGDALDFLSAATLSAIHHRKGDRLNEQEVDGLEGFVLAVEPSREFSRGFLYLQRDGRGSLNFWRSRSRERETDRQTDDGGCLY